MGRRLMGWWHLADHGPTINSSELDPNSGGCGMADVIGIDLGTTYSVVSIFNDVSGQVDVLSNKDGDRITPSVVAVNDDGQVLVGRAAKRFQVTHPDASVKEVKRRMGNLDKINIRNQQLTPQAISSMILRYLKESAELRLGQAVNRVVITCPAHFDESRRAATIQAGELAGLKVLQIINEPTAAALAYGLISSKVVSDAYDDEEEDEESLRVTNVAIYDLGGGTFDVTIFKLYGRNVQVLATDGDQYLGGADFDQEITNWALDLIKKKYGVDLSKKEKAVNRIRAEAEIIKQDLSTAQTRSINIPGLGVTPDGDPFDFEAELTRPEFEEMIRKWLDKSLARVEAALQGAKLTKNQIDEVLLVGGSSRIPAVQRMLKNYFGKEPKATLDPDLCVSIGAAILGATFPVSYDKTASTAGAVPGADEAPGKTPDVGQIIDVVGHSLGVAVMEELPDGREREAFSVLIPRFTPIPAQELKSYSTRSHLQTQVLIEVFQGENDDPRRNFYLGEVQLKGIAPRPDPMERARIDVKFSLDVNGVLSVSAIDTTSGKKQDVTFEFKGTAKLDKQQAEEEMRKLREIYEREQAAHATRSASAGIPPMYQKYWERVQALKERLSGAEQAEVEATMAAFLGALGGKGSVEDQLDKLMDVLIKYKG
jgi:molecular chaperone DnaK